MIVVLNFNHTMFSILQNLLNFNVVRYYSEGHRGKDINGIGGGVRNNAVIIIIIIIIIIVVVVVIILILILFLSAGETTVSMQDGQGNISWRVV